MVTNTNGRKAVLSSVSLTVNIASAGANGLDTGAEAFSTWYYLWVIWNGATVAGLLSTSSTAPTLPSGYTHKGLVGAIYNTSGSNFFWMDQRNNRVICDAVAALSSGTATSYTSVALSAIVPPLARVVSGYARIQASDSSLSRVFLSPSNDAADRGAVVLQNPGAAANNLDAYYRLRLLTAQTIYYKIDSANDDADVHVTGWEY